MSFQSTGQFKRAVTAIRDYVTDCHIDSTDAAVATVGLAPSCFLQRVPAIERPRIRRYAHGQKIGMAMPRFYRAGKIKTDTPENFRGDRCVNILEASLVHNLGNLSNGVSKLSRHYGDRTILKLLEVDSLDNIVKSRGLVFKSEVLRYLYAMPGLGRSFAYRLLSIIPNASKMSCQRLAFRLSFSQCTGLILYPPDRFQESHLHLSVDSLKIPNSPLKSLVLPIDSSRFSNKKRKFLYTFESDNSQVLIKKRGIHKKCLVAT
ncbi:MAG: hypothetical protein ACFE0J_03185 [Elainellaceae cyanobacterium]